MARPAVASIFPRRQASAGRTAPLMLAAVTGPGEAAIALEGGADILHLSDGAASPPPLDRVAAAVAATGGRRPVTAAGGTLPENRSAAAARLAEIAATGVAAIMAPVDLAAWGPEGLRALVAAAAPARLIAILFADRAADLLSPLPALRAAGFEGVMLDIADRSGGRLVARMDIAAIAELVGAARDSGLAVGLAGSLEAPDVPRLLALGPDFLGFRSALCAAADPAAGIDLQAVRAIRALIPAWTSPVYGDVDPQLPATRARLKRSGIRDSTDRIFVRDFVLPVRIGAYKFEKAAPQKVRFDVSVDVQRARGAPHGMAQVFSYDVITDGIRAIVAEGHVDLVETLADRIAALALRQPRAKRVFVRVEKLELEPGGVGVEISVERPATESGLAELLAQLEESAPKPRGQRAR